MKKFTVLFLVLLSGCASTPHTIQDLNVGDTVKVVRGENEGCSLEVQNIVTRGLVPPYSTYVPVEKVCGNFTCFNQSYVTSGDELYCIQFEALRHERTSLQDREMGRGRTR